MSYTFVQKLNDTSHVYVKDGTTIHFVFEYEETTVELLNYNNWEETVAADLLEFDIIRTDDGEIKMMMSDPTYVVYDVDGTLKSCSKLKTVYLDDFSEYIKNSMLEVEKLEKS